MDYSSYPDPDATAITEFPIPQSPPSKCSYALPTLPYDFSSYDFPPAIVIQPDEPAVDSNVAMNGDSAVSPERNTAIRARSDSRNFGALQINFERGDWARGYLIENTGEIDSLDEEWEEDLLPSGSNMDRKCVSKIVM